MRPNKLTQPRPVSWEEVPIIMTVEYAASYIFEASTATVQTWIKEKGLPTFILDGSNVMRIEKNSLRKWIIKNIVRKEEKTA